MKIEFCCRGMEIKYYAEEMFFETQGKTMCLVWNEGDERWVSCPYCGAKIEITVRKEEG